MALKNQAAVLPFNSKRWGKILRLAWYPIFAVALGIFITSIPGFFIIGPGGIADARFSANSSPLILSLAWVIRGAAMATGMLSLFLALLLFRRRSSDRMALFTAFFLLAHGIIMPGSLEGLKPFFPGVASFTEILLLGSVVFLTLFLFAVFPDGRFVPGWTRWVVLAAFLVILFLLYWTSLIAQSPIDFSRPMVIVTGGLSFIPLVVMWISILYAQVYRYRHVSTRKQRQQTKWVIYGMGLWFSFQMITAIPWFHTYSLPPGTQLPLWMAGSSPFWILSIAVIPITLTIAIMRYQLFDIDFIINRTLVYGALTISVAVLYALIVGGAGLLIQADLRMAGLLVTAILAGVLYRPMQAFFQRAADRAFPSSKLSPTQPPVELVTSSPQGYETDQSISPEWGQVLKPLWILSAILVVGILIASLPGYLVRTPMASIRSDLVFNPTPMVLTIHHLHLLISFFSTAFCICLAALLFFKKSDSRMGLFLSFYLLAHGILYTWTIEMLEPFWPKAPFVNSFILLPILAGPVTAALVGLFPDGRFVPNWSRWLVPACLLTLPIGWMMRTGLLFPKSISWELILRGLFIIISIVILTALVYAPIYRYRYISTREQRQQTKWVVYALSLWLLFIGLSIIPWILVQNLPAGAPIPGWLSLAQLAWSISTMFLPVSLTIAVTRYRLYDIDTLINRTLVYGGLSVGVLGVYALVVGSLGVLFQSSDNLIVALVATGLVAVLFNPLRLRLQRAVNRLLYGERDEPLTVLRRLGQRLENSGMPEETLNAIVETVAHTLKFPYAEISLRRGEAFEHAVSHGQRKNEIVSFPVQYQGETIGSLNVTLRGPGEQLAESDLKLLRHIAQQSGPVAHAVQLTRDLHRSRVRTITAREKERRRLRRDLHDGLGPVLASQGLKIAAVTHLLETDPGRVQQILDEIASQNEAAVAEIRRLVYALRPPELDELGLVGAVRDYVAGLNVAQKEGIEIQVQDPEILQESQVFPAAVEVAAYRIATEALTNVIRHSHAHHCEISFVVDSGDFGKELRLEIADDGIGIPSDCKEGVGLNSMRERAEEVGGELHIDSAPQQGTIIVAYFPLSG
jgi:signal transduction histidine kinase